MLSRSYNGKNDDVSKAGGRIKVPDMTSNIYGLFDIITKIQWRQHQRHTKNKSTTSHETHPLLTLQCITMCNNFMSNIITCLVIYLVLFWNVLERLNECCGICLPFYFKLMSRFEFVVQLFSVLFWSSDVMCPVLLFISSLYHFPLLMSISPVYLSLCFSFTFNSFTQFICFVMWLSPV